MIVFSGLTLEIIMITQVLTMIWIQSIKITPQLQANLEAMMGGNESLEVLMEENM